jgi:hypothetical protein
MARFRLTRPMCYAHLGAVALQRGLGASLASRPTRRRRRSARTTPRNELRGCPQYTHLSAQHSPASDGGHAPAMPCFGREDLHAARAGLHVQSDPNPRMGKAFVWPQRPTTPGPLTTLRRSRTHAKPSLAARTYNPCIPSPPFENDPARTHARSPVGRQDHKRARPLAASRERQRTRARAKPCLAGRPTAPLRSQSPEKHTSRGRPPGMELPDAAVVVIVPYRRTRMGPHFEAPPGLFPYSYLVLLPAGSGLLLLLFFNFRRQSRARYR